MYINNNNNYYLFTQQQTSPQALNTIKLHKIKDITQYSGQYYNI
jgi:hypothetical protein